MATLQTGTNSNTGMRRSLSGYAMPTGRQGKVIAFPAYRQAGAPRMRGLGAATPNAADLSALQSDYAQAQANLQQLSNSAASNAAVAAAINVNLAAAQQQATQLAQTINSLVTIWNAIKAALNPLYAVQWASQLATAESQLQVLEASIAAMQSQVASIQGQQVSITSGSATQYSALAAQAYANGDQATGDYYAALAQAAQTTAMNQSQPPSATAGFLGWIEDNALWIGLAVAAIVVLPPLVKKL